MPPKEILSLRLKNIYFKFPLIKTPIDLICNNVRVYNIVILLSLKFFAIIDNHFITPYLRQNYVESC